MAGRKRQTDADKTESARRRSLAYLAAGGLDPALPAAAFGHRFILGIENRDTMRRYALVLGPGWFSWCRARSLDPFEAEHSDAKAYIAELATRYAPKTRGMQIGVLRAFYRDAQRDRLLTHNPFIGLKMNRRRKTRTPCLNLTQLASVVNAMRTQPLEPGECQMLRERDYTLITVAARVGPRSKEMAALTWGDFREEPTGRGELRFHSKGDEWKTTPLPEDAARNLRRWRRAVELAMGRSVRVTDAIFPDIGPDGSNLALASRTGSDLQHVSSASIGRIVKGRFRSAGVVGERMAAHVLRSTAATLAHQHGANAVDIQRMLRHDQLSSTLEYIHDDASAADSWSLDGLVDEGSPEVAA